MADNVRECVRAEIESLGFDDPYEALLESCNRSAILEAAEHDGKVFALYGVSHGQEAGEGHPWLVFTEDIKGLGLSFARHSKQMIGMMQMYFPLLTGYVYTGHKDTIKWLKWLGFTLDDPVKLGVKGDLFHHFHRRDD